MNPNKPRFSVSRYPLILVMLIFLLLEASISLAQEQPVYIDVRTWAEHKVDRIEGDPRIHVSDIVDGVVEQFPDKNTPIRLYCRSGVRSGTAVEKLKAAGYLNVKNVGGIDDARTLRSATQ